MKHINPACDPASLFLLWKLFFCWLFRRNAHGVWSVGVDVCGTRPIRTCPCCGQKQVWLAAANKWVNCKYDN